MVDIDKLVCDFLNPRELLGKEGIKRIEDEIRKTEHWDYTYFLIQEALTASLKRQGLEYKDGSLHYIGEEEVKKAVKEVCENIVGESEPSIIKKGKWYKLIKPIGGLSTVGKIYYACYDGRLLLDNGMVCDVEEVSDHFQLVTEVEIKEVEKPDTIKFDETEKKRYFTDTSIGDEELRNKVKEFLNKDNTVGLDESFWGKETTEWLKEQTDEGSKKIMEVMRKILFAKEPDIDAMVEKLCKDDCIPRGSKPAFYYRQGLEDMYHKLKGDKDE